jgi:subtilisin family serine protease
VEPSEPEEQPTSAPPPGGNEPPEEPEPEPTSRAEAQMQLLRKRLGDVAEPGPATWERTGIQFFVRRDFIMVRDQYAGRVREFLRGAELLPAGDERPPPEGSPRDGAVAYGLQWIRLRPGTGTLRALGLIEPVYKGVAHAEHVLHITSTGTSCPADEPTPVAPGTPPDPAVSTDGSAGKGIRVVVVDTGLDKKAAELPWMRGVRGDPDIGVGGPLLEHYAGHGTFIAGVVRSMAPRAQVVVRSAFPILGTNFELALVEILRDVLLHDNPDVISLSAGTRTLNADGLALLTAFYEHTLRWHKGVAIVAAAGNDGRRKQFWPAAAPWTTSVGALAHDWQSRARFSNHGGWVDVYAPGQHLINAFPRGKFKYNEPPRRGKVARFRGMAIWSGTSFSTPMVAGLIAARMSRTGENGRDAAAALVAQAQAAARPGIGAVLLPDGPCAHHPHARHCCHEHASSRC